MTHIDMEGNFRSAGLKKKITEQIAAPAALMSTEYYIALSEFHGDNVDRSSIHKKALDYEFNRPTTDPQVLCKCSFVNLKELKEKFNEYVINEHIEQLKLVLEDRLKIKDKNKLEETFNSPGMSFFYFVDTLGKELLKRSGISSDIHSHYNVNNPDHKKESLMLAHTTNIVELGDSWGFDRRPGAPEQFFGFLVAKGIIERKALLSAPMLREINNLKLDEVIKQLQDEGVKPVLKIPLITKQMLQGNTRYF